MRSLLSKALLVLFAASSHFVAVAAPNTQSNQLSDLSADLVRIVEKGEPRGCPLDKLNVAEIDRYGKYFAYQMIDPAHAENFKPDMKALSSAASNCAQVREISKKEDADTMSADLSNRLAFRWIAEKLNSESGLPVRLMSSFYRDLSFFTRSSLEDAGELDEENGEKLLDMVGRMLGREPSDHEIDMLVNGSALWIRFDKVYTFGGESNSPIPFSYVGRPECVIEKKTGKPQNLGTCVTRFGWNAAQKKAALATALARTEFSRLFSTLDLGASKDQTASAAELSAMFVFAIDSETKAQDRIAIVQRRAGRAAIISSLAAKLATSPNVALSQLAKRPGFSAKLEPLLMALFTADNFEAQFDRASTTL